jgi:hypothetical protein
LDIGQVSERNERGLRSEDLDRIRASDCVAKTHPVCPKQYSLEMSILGLKERDGAMYLTEHSVIRNKDKVDKLGRTDWADWSQFGDLLFAVDGCLYRVPCKKKILAHLEDAVKVADFSRLQFKNCEAPQEAKRWPNP